MPTDNPNSTAASIYDQFKIKNPESAQKKNELDQDDFLKLMTTELTHQDPFEPMDNGEFLSQIAQFSTVDGITDLNESFSSLSTSMQSNRALQASAMVGRDVLVPGDQLPLTDSNMDGGIQVPATVNNLSLNIYDSAGQLVAQQNLGTHQKGVVRFKWDGEQSDGPHASSGVYTVKAEALVDGKSEEFEILGDQRVESVSLNKGSEGLTLNLANQSSISINKVIQIS
jgi:flagellar basal-body rod modification protein FlgD